MSTADILKRAGFVPVVPELSRTDRDAESLDARGVPAVPAVPDGKYKSGTRDNLTSDELADCTGQSDEVLAAYRKGLQDIADRKAGRIPDGYDYKATCKGCGPVWLFTTGTVDGCPWCWNRAQGLPIPRPKVSNPEFAPGQPRKNRQRPGN